MKKILLASLILFMALSQAISQTQTNKDELQKLSEKFLEKWNTDRVDVLNYSKTNNVPIRIENDSTTMEMQYIDEFGVPQYYITENKNAAATISTNKVNSGGGSGLSLDGSGMIVHEWDGGAVLSTHQEFDSRVTQVDGATTTHYHATHVAGTMIASGVDANAKGMASMANLRAFEWNNDNSEMASEAAGGALVSNHSYGMARGWRWNGSSWDWYGNTSISNTEDYLFGFYDSNAQAWDDIAYNAPYYLICKSAGNDRGDGPGTNPPTAEIDGGTDGYDCIGSQGVAKNILTVGAIDDIPAGYVQPSDIVMSSFSSWGPADDGRIKPDIVANGVGLYSSTDTGNEDYLSISGTSMASPNAAGSLILLQEHYEDLNGTGNYMKAATLKALVIHTADEAGPDDGPDYMFGWGLLNIKEAAKKITEDQTNDDAISEQTLTNSGTYTTSILATSGFPIKVTIVWTDIKGVPVSASLNPSNSMLVNDLDISIEEGTTGTIFYPWKLDRNNPSNAATNTGDNSIDNVEVVYIENPTSGETYTITVNHKGTLSVSQDFSMIISGYPEAPETNFTSDLTTVGFNETVTLSDLSTNSPSSWTWSINPTTYNFVNGTTATSQNIQVEFTEEGEYDISLIAQNAYGSNTKTESSYITVVDAPTGYCDAYSTNPAGHIESFQFGTTTNNFNGYTNIGGVDPFDEYYQDFTSIVIEVNLLETYSLYVLNGYDGAGEDLLDLSVWIDFNRNGDFGDVGEQVVCDPDNYGEGTFSVSIPADAELGATRLRVRTKYNGSDCGSPCGSTGNGEVEDYTLYMRAGTLTWDGSESNNWNDPNNWDQGIVPSASWNVLIPDAASVPNSPLIELGDTGICADCTLDSGADLRCDGSLLLTAP